MNNREVEKSKKGFTLIEILVVCVIIAILTGTIIAAVNIYMKRSKETYDQNIEKQVVLSGKNYWSENNEKRPLEIGDKKYITLKELAAQKLLKNDVIDSANNSCMEESYVVAEKTNSGTEYHVCLICGGVPKTNYEQCDLEEKAPNYKVIYYYDNKNVTTVVQETNTFTIQSSVPTEYSKDGFILKGWSKSKGGTKELDLGEKFTFNENKRLLRLYAVWEAEQNIYNVKYYSNNNIKPEKTSLKTIEIDKTAKHLTSEEVSNWAEKGYKLVGWSTKREGTNPVAPGSIIKINGVEKDKTYNYYAQWEKVSKNVTIKVNNTQYANTDGKTTIPIAYKESGTFTIKVKWPVDRYRISNVTCDEQGVTGEGKPGQGAGNPVDYSKRTDTITITNNSTTTKDVTCTVNYKPYWTGVEKGTYTKNTTVTYAGLKWTVVKDNGDDVTLVYNGVSSYGKFADAQTKLVSFLEGNATMKTDRDHGGLNKHSDGSYANSSSGTKVGYNSESITTNTKYNYWVGSTSFYNLKTRNHKKYVRNAYVSGFTQDRDVSDLLGIKDIKTGVTTAATTNIGIVSTNDANISINSEGKAVFANTASSTYETTNWYYSGYGRRLVFVKSYSITGESCTSGGKTTGDKRKLCFWNPSTYYEVAYRSKANGGSYKVFPAERTDYYVDSDAQVTGYICGGDYHKKRVRYRYKSTTEFYYGHEGTKTGWSAWTSHTGFDSSKDTYSIAYRKNDKNWKAEFAGRDLSYCSQDSSKNENCTMVDGRGYRWWHYDNASYCKQRKNYTIGTNDIEVNLYYRPQIKVRER